MLRLMSATALALVMAAACANNGDTAKVDAAAPALAATPERIDNFRLVDHTGRANELYRLADAKAVVLTMHGVGCPIVAEMAPELKALQAKYAEQGVEFMMVNSTLGATREAIAADAEKLGVAMPIVQDDMQFVGEQLGASRSGEVYVVDPKTWKVAYRGPLNANFAEGGSNASAAAAIDAVMKGEAKTQTVAEAKGCGIDMPGLAPQAKASFQKISYSETIAPILEEKCVACHQQGGIAPFAMDNYELVKGFAPMMREAIRTDRMPPWDADPHVGKFKDDKGLTPDQAKTLVRWIEAGAPRGEGADPLAAVKRVAPEWPLGKPDLIVDIPAYTIPASGYVDYQYPTTPNPLTEGKWLKAATAKVSQRQGVHHILSGIIAEGETRRGMQAWGGSVGGYTVGMESVEAPKGIGSWIPAGGEFAYQMHYTPFGKEAVSAEQIGLYFYKDGEKPDLMMRENPLVDQFIELPPNDGNHKEVAYFLFPQDAVLHTAVVHAHYRGTYSKLEVISPDGKRETILNVPFYDFNWQRMYEFEKPIDIKAGSKVVATYIYDNSKRNPANPNPEEKVVWGDQSFEEMFYTSLRYRWKDETVANPKPEYEEQLLSTRLIGMLDDNLDDKVQPDELRGQFAALKPQFALGDANKDGGIDAKEFDVVMGMMRAMRRGGGAPPAATSN
jgi:hypothetical protein